MAFEQRDELNYKKRQFRRLFIAVLKTKYKSFYVEEQKIGDDSDSCICRAYSAKRFVAIGFFNSDKECNINIYTKKSGTMKYVFDIEKKKEEEEIK